MYIAKIDSRGFDVAEANNGNANIEYNYIIVGKKLDLNVLPISREVLNRNFSDNLPAVMFNEGNTDDNALPMWWDGSKFQYSTPPLNNKEIDTQQKKKEMIEAEKRK